MDDEAVSQRSADSREAPALLCFDGSDDAAAAIAKAGEYLAPRSAVVLTVWEPVRVWEPWDPVTIVSAPLGRLVAEELDADPIVIGSRGLGRAQSALLGSVSSAVIAHAKRAVLVGPAHVAGGGAGPVRSE